MDALIASLQHLAGDHSDRISKKQFRALLAGLGKHYSDADFASLVGGFDDPLIDVRKWMQEIDEGMQPANCSHDSHCAESAEQQYSKVIESKGGAHFLKACMSISEKAQHALRSTERLLRKERDAIWEALPTAKAERLRQIATELEATATRQDPIYGCMPYHQMQLAAKPIKAVFDSLLDSIRQKLSAVGVRAVQITGLKGKERGEKKVAVDYAGDGSKLTDMIRGTLEIYGNIQDLYRVVSELINLPELNSSTITIETIKDRYQVPCKGGYRDISVLIRIRGMLCELQLNLKEVLLIKESKAGHGLYEKSRLVTDDLLYSSMKGDLQGLQEAIAAGGDVDVQDGRYKISALSFGACTGNQKAVGMLLESGADPCKIDTFGILPIHRAARGGFLLIVHDILKAMRWKTPTAENKSLLPSTQFAELLGLVLDQGWDAVAVDLHAWWIQGESIRQSKVLRQWVKLGWTTTISRAADVFQSDFWDIEDEETFCLAAAVLPDVVKLFLDKGFRATAQKIKVQVDGYTLQCEEEGIDGSWCDPHGKIARISGDQLITMSSQKNVWDTVALTEKSDTHVRTAKSGEAEFKAYSNELHWLDGQIWTHVSEEIDAVSAISIARAFGHSDLVQLLQYAGADVKQISAKLEGEACSLLANNLMPLDLIAASVLTIRDALHIPSQICHLHALQNLVIDHCSSLSSVPEELGQLQALKNLSFRFCDSLSSLPSALGNLQSLRNFTVRSTGLTSLPVGVRHLQALQNINIIGCDKLACLPVELCHLQALQNLTISCCVTLISLPAELGNLHALQNFVISGCSALTSLPAELGKLQALRNLTIDDCHNLTCLPPELGDIQALQHLTIAYCLKLTCLPHELGQLQKLTALIIQGLASIVSLPAELSKLQMLVRLTIKQCDQLTGVPAGLDQLQALQQLLIDDCPKVRSLPEDLVQLQMRRDFSISSHLAIPQHCRCCQLQTAPSDVFRVIDLGTGEMGFYTYRIDITTHSVACHTGPKSKYSRLGGFFKDFLSSEGGSKLFAEIVIEKFDLQKMSVESGYIDEQSQMDDMPSKTHRKNVLICVTGENRQMMVRSNHWRTLMSKFADDLNTKLRALDAEVQVLCPQPLEEAGYELAATEWLVENGNIDIGDMLLSKNFRTLSNGDDAGFADWQEVSSAFADLRAKQQLQEAYCKAACSEPGLTQPTSIPDCVSSARFYKCFEENASLMRSLLRARLFTGVLSAGGGSSQVTWHVADNLHGENVESHSFPMGNKSPLVGLRLDDSENDSSFFSKRLPKTRSLAMKLLCDPTQAHQSATGSHPIFTRPAWSGSDPVTKEKLDMWRELMKTCMEENEMPSRSGKGVFIGISAIFYAAKEAGCAEMLLPRNVFLEKLQLKTQELLASDYSSRDSRGVTNMVLASTFIEFVLHPTASIVCKRNWKVGEIDMVATWSLGMYLKHSGVIDVSPA